MKVKKYVVLVLCGVAVCGSAFAAGLSDYGVDEMEETNDQYIKVSVDSFNPTVAFRELSDEVLEPLGSNSIDGEWDGAINGFSVAYGRMKDTGTSEHMISFRSGDQTGTFTYQPYFYNTSNPDVAAESTRSVSLLEWRYSKYGGGGNTGEKFLRYGFWTGGVNYKNEKREDVLTGSTAGTSITDWSVRNVKYNTYSAFIGGGYVLQYRISRLSVGARADFELCLGYGELTSDTEISSDSVGNALAGYRAKGALFAEVDAVYFSLFGEFGGLSYGDSGSAFEENDAGSYARVGMRVIW
jgi:hypothetical protein